MTKPPSEPVDRRSGEDRREQERRKAEVTVPFERRRLDDRRTGVDRRGKPKR